MSIKVMTLVWDNFPSNGSELLAMLALADWCNDTGGSLHPSIATVAKKIRLSECQARRIIHGLIEQGYLTVIGNHAGGDPGCTRQYRINLGMITPSADDTPSVSATPSAHARDPYHGCASTPSAGESLTVIEPLGTVTNNTPKKKPRRQTKQGTTLPDDWRPNDRHKQIASNFNLNLIAECRKFMDHHEAKGSLFVSWDAAFRTWLGNAAEWNKNKPSNKTGESIHDKRANTIAALTGQRPNEPDFFPAAERVD